MSNSPRRKRLKLRKWMRKKGHGAVYIFAKTRLWVPLTPPPIYEYISNSGMGSFATSGRVISGPVSDEEPGGNEQD
jgi:hypothetical protein